MHSHPRENKRKSIYLPENKSVQITDSDTAKRIELENTTLTFGTALLENPTADQVVEGAPPPQGPVILLKQNQETKTIDLRRDFINRFVRHAFYNEKQKWLYVFLDSRVDGPAEEFIILFSQNGGKTWIRYADLKRPPYKFPIGELVQFYLDKNGKGIALFHSEGTDDSQLTTPYVVTTLNGGKSWEYEKKPWQQNILREALNPAPSLNK